MLDIHSIMRGLAEKRPVFHSEADFQSALKQQIRETVPGSEVLLEWKPIEDENLHVDVWIPSHGVAIELKYFTYPFNGKHELGEFKPVESRYDFLRDVERVERIVHQPGDTKRGYAVSLTNLRALWTTPSPGWRQTNDAAFRIHCGREINGELKWSSKNKRQYRTDPIHLKGSYTTKWRNYSCAGPEKNAHFRYLAIEVKK